MPLLSLSPLPSLSPLLPAASSGPFASSEVDPTSLSLPCGQVAVKASLVKISSIFSFVESISEASSDVSIGDCSLSVPLQQQLISSNKKVRDSPAALGVWAMAGVCAGPWRPGRWALGRGVGAGGAERGGGPSQRPDTTRSCRACVCDCRVGSLYLCLSYAPDAAHFFLSRKPAAGRWIAK